MTFSSDTRWAVVSTIRGTTHVFPVAPYGGPVGVRTHSTPHVVNRLSRFHRSAGLTDDGTRSHSPVSHTELPVSVYPYSNPRLPPYPHPTILHPLAQIRQISTLNHSNSQSQPSRPQQRQRLHSEDSGTLPLKICACFAPPRAWIYAQRDSTSKVAKRAVDSLFIMACHGNMIQYDLEPKPAAGVPKEKVCDDTTIELEVEAKGQWPLLRTPNSLEIVPPLTSSSPLLSKLGSPKISRQLDPADDRWLSQVEIVTHAGPHRRLWMGPQFVFKTYNALSGVNLIESEAIEIGVTGGSRPARSNPVNMPHVAAPPLVPVVTDGSGSSYEQSPRFVEAYGGSLDNDNDTMGIGNGENQLREDLAEAMLETSIAPHHAAGRRLVVERVGQPVTKVVNPLGTVITIMADEEDVSSSQEFDDPTPEPPRSLCAEEGPTSLGDFDTEGEELRNVTEVCAEMRSTSGPAIDSVPNDGVKEVTEKKPLYVAAITSSNKYDRPTIDYEREESFRDVPTSLSLCVEQGEIPNSPMALARENNWNKRTVKHENIGLQERTYAKARYVVNYDDVSIVLMENNSGSKPTISQQETKESCSKSFKDSSETEVATRKNELEPERASKRPSKITSSTRATKRSSSCVVREHPMYLVHEHEDSIVIEDTSMPENKISSTSEDEAAATLTNESTTIKTSTDENLENFNPETRQRRGLGKERCSAKNLRTLDSPMNTLSENEAMIVESRQLNVEIEISDTFVDRTDNETTVNDAVFVETMTNDSEPMEATMSIGLASLPLELQPPPPVSDDISCMDYHIVETNSSLPLKETAYSHQSDDDIEHIHSSEVTQMLEIVDSTILRSDDFETSPTTRQRKSSKSTISDDDIEHIHSAELVDIIVDRGHTLLNVGKSCVDERTDIDDFQRINVTRTSNNILPFDDDIEHVYHSETNELEPVSKDLTCSDSPGLRATTKTKTQENVSNERNPGLRGRGSRKRKDVVVIDSDTSEAEITVVLKTLDSWNKSKTPEKDLAEEIDRCVEPKEQLMNKMSSQSLPKKTRVRTPKGNLTGTTITTTTTSTTTAIATTSMSQKRQPSSDVIEIIDIDAMQKAEIEVPSVVDVVVTSDCKILESRHETNPIKWQKSRRSKKAHLDNIAPTTVENVIGTEISEMSILSKLVSQDSEDAMLTNQQTPINWSLIPRIPDDGGNTDAAETCTELRDTMVKSSREDGMLKDVAVRVGMVDKVIQQIEEKALTKTIEKEPRVASSSTVVVEKISSTKKRGKKSRIGAAVDNSSTPVPVTNTIEFASIVEILSNDEQTTSRHDSRSCEKTAVSTSISISAEEKKETNSTIDIVSDVKMFEETIGGWKYDDEIHQPEVSSATLSKDCPPQLEVPADGERDSERETEKPNDSDVDAQPERSSSSDDLNANVVPMDTEEDSASREIAEKIGATTGVSPSWSTVNKKNTRSKKKKRR